MNQNQDGGPAPAAPTPAVRASSSEGVLRRATLIKWVLIAIPPFFSLACIVLHAHLSAAVQQRITAAGYVPMPNSPNDENTLYWLHQPGQGLHIVGLSGTDFRIAIAILVFTLFLTLLAWMLRKTVASYAIVALTVVFNVACTGAISARPGFAIDLRVTPASDTIVASGKNLKICDVTTVHTVMRPGLRGRELYRPTAQLKSGSAVELAALFTQQAADQVAQAVQRGAQTASCR